MYCTVATSSVTGQGGCGQSGRFWLVTRDDELDLRDGRVPEDIFRGFHSPSDGKDIRMWPATTFASRILWPRPFTVYSRPGYSALAHVWLARGPYCARYAIYQGAN